MTDIVKDEPLSIEILESMSQSKLEELAREKAREIFLNIHNANEKIKEAKELSVRASTVETDGSDGINFATFGFAGKSMEDKLSDRINLTNKAQISQNEAIFELSKIVQESIKFTQLTSKFSSSLQQAMSFLFKNGLKDANGNTTKLSDESAKAFCDILDAADQFAASQARLDYKIDQIYSNLDKNHQIDEKQSQIIQSNSNKISELLLHMDEKGQLDQEQEKLIAKNTQAIMANTEILRNLQTRKDTKIYIIAIASLLLSVISIVLHFVR